MDCLLRVCETWAADWDAQWMRPATVGGDGRAVVMVVVEVKVGDGGGVAAREDWPMPWPTATMMPAAEAAVDDADGHDAAQ
ncbi:hypothetical protein ColTof3_01394 [Colletotrichum tofieldiae]|nr:hypothetical protein ColTof3_01394 [Colletotrichum tofieldiae]GKT95750.1 hypothetical protein Ct61P_13600 [Colletotrichum tofieldiae]